jgi:hypothetical protein
VVTSFTALDDLERAADELAARAGFVPRLVRMPGAEAVIAATFSRPAPPPGEEEAFVRACREHPEPPAWEIEVPALRRLASALATRWSGSPGGPLFEVLRHGRVWRLRFGPALSREQEGEELSRLVAWLEAELTARPPGWTFA